MPEPIQTSTISTGGQLTPEVSNPQSSASVRRKPMQVFLILFLVGFLIGWFFYRNREQKTKIMAGVIGGFLLPIIAYMTIGRIGFDSAPPKASIKNFFATYGFGDFEKENNSGPKMPTK